MIYKQSGVDSHGKSSEKNGSLTIR